MKGGYVKVPSLGTRPQALNECYGGRNRTVVAAGMEKVSQETHSRSLARG